MLKILTKGGFKEFDGLRRKRVNGLLEVKVEDYSLSCTLNHPVITTEGVVEAQDLHSQHKVYTTKGIRKIIDVNYIDTNSFVYDVLNVKNNHQYFSGGILSHNCSFEGTGDTYIDGEILVQLNSKVNKHFVRKYNNRMRVWKDPKSSHEYCLSVDVSLGRGRDQSAFHIIDLWDGEQVAEFYSNRTPINEVAKIVSDMGYYYNTAYVIVERNTYGNVLIDRLIETEEYENVWQDKKGKFGYETSVKTREILLADLEEAIRTQRITVNSARTVKELLTFIINDNGKAEADVNCTDDLVISLALASHLIKELLGSSPIDMQISDEVNPPPLPQGVKYSVRTSNGEEIDEDYLKWINS